MTRSRAARARRRHHRRRWVTNSIELRRLMLAAMADITCPGFRAAYPQTPTLADVTTLMDRIAATGYQRARP